MFDLLALTVRDAAMVAAGVVSVAIIFVAVGVAHKATPAIVAWFAKEKTTVLAIEDRMKSGFGFTSKAIYNVEANAKAGDAALDKRMQALEMAVFGPAKPVA